MSISGLLSERRHNAQALPNPQRASRTVVESNARKLRPPLRSIDQFNAAVMPQLLQTFSALGDLLAFAPAGLTTLRLCSSSQASANGQQPDFRSCEPRNLEQCLWASLHCLMAR